MKKLTFAVCIALALIAIAPVRAQSPSPCSTCKVPEPSLLLQLGSGLSVLGGLLVLGRKRFLKNK
jgi:hypothetical protein